MSVEKKVLIVDDDEEFLKEIRQALSDEGYTVLTAPTAQEAKNIFKKEHPAVILLDKKLPDMDGQKLFGEFRKMSRHAAIIIITAYSSVGSVVEGFRDGIVDYIPKPAPVEKILQTIGKAFKLIKKKEENQKKLEKLHNFEEYEREVLEWDYLGALKDEQKSHGVE